MGDITYVDIPGQAAHPAVLVLAVEGRWLVMVGTGSPQDEAPVATISASMARRVGLTKETSFYRKWLYLWCPQVPQASIKGQCPHNTLGVLRRVANEEIAALVPNVAGRVKRLPDGAFVPLSTAVALNKAAQPQVEGSP